MHHLLRLVRAINQRLSDLDRILAVILFHLGTSLWLRTPSQQGFSQCHKLTVINYKWREGWLLPESSDQVMDNRWEDIYLGLLMNSLILLHIFRQVKMGMASFLPSPKDQARNPNLITWGLLFGETLPCSFLSQQPARYIQVMSIHSTHLSLSTD